MRFRARSTKAQTAFLAALLPPISNLGLSRTDNSALLISESYFSIFTNPPSSQITAHAQLSMKSIFTDHKIDSRESNSILLEFDPPHLLAALKSLLASGAETVQLKLQKKNGQPFIVIETLQMGSSNAKVLHDIPVKIMKISEDLPSHQPPPLSHSLVHLLLPPASYTLLRTSIERLKNMSPTVCSASIGLQMDMKGNLTMSIEHDGFANRVFFENFGVDYRSCVAGRDYKIEQLKKFREKNDQPLDCQEDAHIADDETAKTTVAVAPDVLLKLFKWQGSWSKLVHEATLCVHKFRNGTKILVLECDFHRERDGTDGGKVEFYASVSIEDEGEQDDGEEEEEEGGS